MEQVHTIGWREAAKKFITEWEDLEDFEGALVTGSYVIGTATPESDLDIHIVLSSKTEWRERGNKRIDGYLIEYFANPPYRFPAYLEEDLQAGSRAILTQLTTGQILVDKRGEVAKLVEWAERQRLETPLLEVSAEKLEALKYHLWDTVDGLIALYNEDSPLFEASCGCALNDILKTYAAYLRVDIPAFSKIYKFFTSPMVSQAYRMQEFPDDVFVTLFIQTLQGEKETRLRSIQNLAEYVLERMSGFQIEGWVLRTPAK